MYQLKQNLQKNIQIFCPSISHNVLYIETYVVINNMKSIKMIFLIKIT